MIISYFLSAEVSGSGTGTGVKPVGEEAGAGIKALLRVAE